MPADFKERFLASVRIAFAHAPPGLMEEQSEFVLYDLDQLTKHGVGESTANFLSVVGMPRSAAPFLHFHRLTEEQLAQFYDVAVQSTLFLLGGNGSGDPLGVEKASQAVVYLNHDCGNKRVFINTTIESFAESLCLFQTFLQTKDRARFLADLQAIDPAAAGQGAMWPEESIFAVS